VGAAQVHDPERDDTKTYGEDCVKDHRDDWYYPTQIVTVAGLIFFMVICPVLLVIFLWCSVASAEVAIVTGSASGLGWEMSNILDARGYDLVQNDIKDFKTNHTKVVCDLADPSCREEIIFQTMIKHGRVDLLISNAGYLFKTNIEHLDLDSGHRMMEVNFWAGVDLAKRVVPIMRNQGGGTIIAISSSCIWFDGRPGYGMYRATKEAIKGVFMSLRKEIEAENIKVIIPTPEIFQSGIDGTSHATKTAYSVAHRILEEIN